MRAWVSGPWYRAEVLDEEGAGTGQYTDQHNGCHKSQIVVDYPLVAVVDDVGLPSDRVVPGTNLGLWAIECDGATLAAIEADDAYEVEASEEV